MVSIKVIRMKSSYDYKYNNPKLNEYQNNTRNNMQDELQLIDTHGNIIFKFEAQTVSNHPKYRHEDTIQAGNFEVKCFVKQGGFNTPIHGIIKAKDIEGQDIDEYSMQKDKGQYIGRWLIHSSFHNESGRDTKGYSGGCFILSTIDMKRLNKALQIYGVTHGSIIKASLVEV